jgi:hypothetical protein
MCHGVKKAGYRWKVAESVGLRRVDGKNYRVRAAIAYHKRMWQRGAMKIPLGLILVCAGTALGVGCASGKWQAEQIPVPRSTPFDGNQLARNAFLEGYREGFRAQKNNSQGVELVSGPYREAKLAGFRAGAAEARATQTGDTAPASPIGSGK